MKEVRYIVGRKSGAQAWEKNGPKILSLPVEIVPADQSMAALAGEIKSSRKMSLADCFAAALAKRRDGEIYTGDPEFKALGPDWKIVRL
jgi:predicted nucleic acid-binding protein